MHRVGEIEPYFLSEISMWRSAVAKERFVCSPLLLLLLLLLLLSLLVSDMTDSRAIPTIISAAVFSSSVIEAVQLDDLTSLL